MADDQKKYQIRKAKLTDIPQLVGLIEEVMQNEIRLGNKTLTKDPEHLRAGIMINMGQMYDRSDVRIEIASNGTGRIIGFIVGIIELCPPTEAFLKGMRVWLDYMKEDSLAGPKLLMKMWDRLRSWAEEQGAGCAYGHILPKNIPSIRAAKHMGLRHHYTQFLLVFGDQEQTTEV